MATTIRATPERSRMPGVPNARVGGMSQITADDLGGASLREAMRLSQNMGMFGEQQVQWAQRIENDRLEAKLAESEVDVNRDTLRKRTELLQLQGKEAEDVPRLMDEYTSQRMDEELAKLGSQKAKDLFQKRMRTANFQNSATMDAWAIRQTALNKQTALEANSQVQVDWAIANAGNNAAIRDNIAKIRSNVAEMYRGQPEEFIRLEGNKRAMLAIEGVANALAVQQSPQAALDFLNSGVDREIGDGALKVKLDAMRKQYEMGAQYQEINDTAFAWVEQDKPSDEALVEAYKLYPDDPSKPENVTHRKQLLGLFDEMTRRKAWAASLRAAQKKKDVLTSFMQAGFDYNKLSEEEKADTMLDPDLFQAVTNFQHWYGKTENKKLDPDLHWAYRMQQLEPSEVRDWLNQAAKEGEESNFDVFLRKTAGDTALMNKIMNHSLKEDGGGKGGSVSGGRGAAKFNPTMFFQDMYRDIYTTSSWIFWDAPENYFDADTIAARSRLNGFLLRYNSALAEFEAREGRTATTKEQEDLAAELATEIRAKPETLESSFYMAQQREAAGEAPEIAVPSQELSDDEVRLNMGEPTVMTSIVPGTEPVKFGNISPTDTNLLPPNIINLKAKKVLRAYTPGTIGDIFYNPGDFLAFTRYGEIAVFDRDTEEMRGDPIMFRLPGQEYEKHPAEAAKAAATERVMREEKDIRRQLNAVKNKREKLRQIHVQDYGRPQRKSDPILDWLRGREPEYGPSRIEENSLADRPYRMAAIKHRETMAQYDKEITQLEERLRRLHPAKESPYYVGDK